jgi:Carbohydrate esterase 2 N-terminal
MQKTMAVMQGWTRRWARCGSVAAALLIAVSCSACGGQAPASAGMEFVGRWMGPEGARVATYGGSAVLLTFRNSSSVRLDVTVANTPGNDSKGKLYIRVIVDGGAPLRIGLERGEHPAFLLAENLSLGSHVVEVRHDQEPFLGALQVGCAALEAGGVWETFTDTRPIIEVIEDSDATGICILGPTNPAKPANLGTPEWESQILSWPALLETNLRAMDRPAVVVDLALSGSTAGGEAETYDQAAPLWSKEKFTTYSGGRHASLVLLWGGSNEKNQGGDMATGTPVTYANLSPFQRGIYDQIMKVTALNPDAQLGLLEYVDPNVPQWMPAYLQLEALLPTQIQRKLHFLSVKDDSANFNACEAAPHGHPDLTTHERWTAQILQWIVAEKLLPPAER